jgi:hypothetical protein
MFAGNVPAGNFVNFAQEEVVACATSRASVWPVRVRENALTIHTSDLDPKKPRSTINSLEYFIEYVSQSTFRSVLS